MTFNIEDTGNLDQGAPEGQPNQQPASLDQGAQSADQGITPTNIDEILKRDEHAQQHITSLEKENKDLRDNFTAMQEQLEAIEGKLASQKKLEELLTGKNTSNNQEADQGNPPMNTPTEQGLDQASIDSMISARMQEYLTKQEQDKNYSAATATLGSMFKDKADDHVRTVASSNGLTFEAAQDLAKSNPTLFNNLFVTPFKGSSNHTPAPTQSRQSTSSVPEQTSEINMEYWNKLRRENPTKFQSVQTQKAFHTWFHNNKSN